jgi:gamma-glutamyltranspeptidase/glutathione hydrolase
LSILRKTKVIVIFLLLSCLSFAAVARENVIDNRRGIFHPVIATQGMVSTQEKLATQVGLEVLKEGGNAIDAAVTIGFALSVTLPRAGNLGGGGFMLIHSANTKEIVAIDYRETAPLGATKDMFLDENGEVDPDKSKFTHLAVGVPGTVAGMALALEKYGTFSLKKALEPAIDLAENGFPVSQDLYESLIFAQERLQRSPSSKEIFYKDGNNPYEVGELLIQKDLAKSLKLIAEEGIEAFYQGEIGEKIVEDSLANGGIMTKEDLASYQPVIREPIKGNYRDYRIYAMSPPSAGGVHLVQMLNVLEKFPIRDLGFNRANTLHLLTEVMKLSYADRSKFLGDPDFVDVPVSQLISEEYADTLRSKINLNKATPSVEILPGNPLAIEESPETTHYSVMDQEGNVVSNTYTLNFSYGIGWTVAGTGILLNNEMDDFAAKPGVANAFGLIGGEKNTIEPGKRMLSSMTPTIVLKEGKPFLVTGSPGGSTIITTVLQLIINVIDHQMNIAEATNAPRIHHQWQPDQLFVENALNGDTIELLKAKGHFIVTTGAWGSTQSIMSVEGIMYGASDPRTPDALTLGY